MPVGQMDNALWLLGSFQIWFFGTILYPFRNPLTLIPFIGVLLLGIGLVLA